MKIIVIFCICYLIWYCILYLRHVNEEKIDNANKLNNLISLKPYVVLKRHQ